MTKYTERSRVTGSAYPAPFDYEMAPGSDWRPFLAAEWRDLLMLNYAVDRASLSPHVPRGTELDQWNGTTYLSVVGFQFLNTKILGIPVPGHRSFCEVNLRFYVRRRAPDGWRRGVVFLKEIVPRRAVVAVARALYGEPYIYREMSHQGTVEEVTSGADKLTYRWRYGEDWDWVGGRVAATPAPLESGSEAEFIAEHYWGYTARRAGRTTEYQVAHPRWLVSAVAEPELVCDVSRTWGSIFADALSDPPLSAFAAVGSAVAVGFGAQVA